MPVDLNKVHQLVHRISAPMDTGSNFGWSHPYSGSESLTERMAKVASSNSCSNQCDRRDDYEDGTIEEKRRILRRDSSFGIPEIDVDLFVSYLLPPPLKNGIIVEDVISCLRRDGLVISDNKWRYFDTAPAEGIDAEDVVFGPLADICKACTSCAAKTTGREPTFVLSLLPSRLHSEHLTRPDGYFILKESEDRAQSATDKKDKARWWYDIAFTAEFKKGGSVEDIDDNVNKLVFNAQQTMTLDASRRFTFGITVENKSMRLWFFSRATAVTSKQFDFTKRVNLLTYIFLSFAFASKEELGWDPTIRPFAGRDGQRRYEIDVADETYVTERVLSDSTVDALIGRATRVWKATSLKSGESVVLKDVWVEDDRELEHVIYDKILHDVEEKYGAEVRKEVEPHLLTPVAHWLVPTNGEEDHTTRVMMRGYKLSLKRKISLKMKKPRKNTVNTSDDSAVVNGVEFYANRRELRAPFPRLYRRRLFHRRHYRIVFREFADTLDTVRNLSDIFIVLRDSAKALKWIHGCGWVHRDLSVGNLYIYYGRGLIGDLEYAKRKNHDVVHEFRIGTHDFMAIETVKRRYDYRPFEEVNDIDAAIAACVTGSIEMESGDAPPFFHNDLHDLESLWWIVMWELVFHWDSSEMQVTGGKAEEQDAQRELAMSELFPNADNIDDRTLFFDDRRVFEAKIMWMSENLRTIKGIMNTLRGYLILKYRAFEAQFPAINMDAFQGVQDMFAKLFDVCRNRSIGLELVPYKMIAVRNSTQDGAKSWNLTVPSLERDNEDETSDHSLSDLEIKTQEAVSLMTEHVRATKCSEPNWRTCNEDFLTPRPSLYIAKYELEVC